MNKKQLLITSNKCFIKAKSCNKRIFSLKRINQELSKNRNLQNVLSLSFIKINKSENEHCKLGMKVSKDCLLSKNSNKSHYKICNDKQSLNKEKEEWKKA